MTRWNTAFIDGIRADLNEDLNNNFLNFLRLSQYTARFVCILWKKYTAVIRSHRKSGIVFTFKENNVVLLRVFSVMHKIFNMRPINYFFPPHYVLYVDVSFMRFKKNFRFFLSDIC